MGIDETLLRDKGFIKNKDGSFSKARSPQPDIIADLPKTVIAIDPGSSGGIAISHPMGIGDTQRKLIAVGSDKITNLASILRGFFNPVAYVELVTGFIAKPKKPKPGEKAEFRLENQSHLMFNFGKNAGRIEGILEALEIPFFLVHPAVWQKPLFLSKKGTPREKWKKRLQEEAQRRFPSCKVTLATADALLILNYAMLREEGRINGN